MRLPRIGRRAVLEREFNAHEVMWGVRRRAGYGDTDDPSAHAGLIQHAFLIGDATTALCGFKPLRFGRRRAMPLALATDYNPHCRRCLSAVALPATTLTEAGGERLSWGGRPAFALESRFAMAGASGRDESSD
jgi:hypothetical protein